MIESDYRELIMGNQLKPWLIVPNYEDYVRDLSHQIWLDEGKLDGEEIVETANGQMRLKDLHWIKAESLLLVVISNRMSNRRKNVNIERN